MSLLRLGPLFQANLTFFMFIRTLAECNEDARICGLETLPPAARFCSTRGPRVRLMQQALCATLSPSISPLLASQCFSLYSISFFNIPFVCSISIGGGILG
ncbi:hypothetical protein BDV96DRAFT_135608 [Lophiotrema nucula]|uniref:Secreted protein n=1 Tax=Lophiotrema nucula TaxID=690887 RepID=A0A6A5ZR73_9PLEO|nr:hypothetical protein BDV96DRAFT_135608 [Lophiotrema nucula]